MLISDWLSDVCSSDLSAQGEDPLLLVLPSDHVVRDAPAFREAVRAAAPVAEQGALVTFGIVPESAETGFGYIQSEAGDGVRRVLRFVEKPDARSEEHTSELQSLMRISYAVLCLTQNNTQ